MDANLKHIKNSNEKLSIIPAAAAAAAAAAGGSTSSNGGGGLRPLNRKQHEQQLEQLQHHIQIREEEKQRLQDRQRVLRDELSEFRSQRDRISDQRTEVDAKLTAINKQVDSKRDHLQKLRSSMLYQNEDLIVEQIQKLEYQLRKHNFKPSEEKKIIIEINRLKRSKNLLKEYNVLKAEADVIRETQREIREKRDSLFRERGDVKRKEDTLKKESREIRERLEELKAQIDDLWQEKKQLVADFRALENRHKQLQYERREEYRQKKKEDKMAQEEQKQRELNEIKANSEPFESERHLCASLITYCMKFEMHLPLATDQSSSSSSTATTTSGGFLSVPTVNGGGGGGSRRGSNNSRRGSDLLTPSSEGGDSTYGTPLGATPVSTPVEEPGCFVYKKKSTDENMDPLFAGINKKLGKKQARQNRRNSSKVNKPLTHNPDTFSQFLSLGLKPPVNTSEIMSVIQELKSKQKYFEEEAAKIKEARSKGVNEVDGDIPVAQNGDDDHDIVHINLVDETHPPVLTVLVTQASVPDDDECVSGSTTTNAESTENSSSSPTIILDAFPSLPKPASVTNPFLFNDSSRHNNNKTSSGDIRLLTKSLKKDLQVDNCSSSEL